MVGILALGSLLLWILMPRLMPLVVPNFSAADLTQTITLARWLSLTPVLFGISYVLSGILNSFHRFVVYSLAPLFYNGSIILTTAIFADHYAIDTRVFVVALGVIIGAALHMAIQLPVAAALGWHWRPLFSIGDPAVKKVGKLMGPRIIGLLGLQLVTVVATALGSAWSGAITYYSLANNIQTMPSAVFANSIATAPFPRLPKRRPIGRPKLSNNILCKVVDSFLTYPGFSY